MNVINGSGTYIQINSWDREFNVSESATYSKEKLQGVCRRFESIFVNYLLQKMRQTIPESDFFERGASHDIITSMYDQALAEEISKNRSIGLADVMYRQLSRYMDE